MPKYTYECNSCSNKQQLYKNVNTVFVNCLCGSTMQRQVPKVSNSSVKETIDTYTNISVDPDNKNILEQRSSEHFWTVLVPRLCQEHPADHCLREGWMYIDEKGKLQIQTKPPHRR